MSLIFFLLMTISLVLIGLFLYAKSQFSLPASAEALIDEVIAAPNDQVVFDKMQYVELPDTSICYEDIPSKDPDAEVVVLLHGLSQTLLNFPPYFCQPFIDAGFRLIRLDHQGGGGSSWVDDWKLSNPYDLKDMARHVVQVMDHLGVEQFHVVGMSMGGMISQQIAIDFPQRVASLTSIMSSAHTFDPTLIKAPPKFILGLVYCVLAYGSNLRSLKAKMRFNLVTNRLLYGDGSYPYDDRVTVEAAHYEITKKKGYNIQSGIQHFFAIRKAGSRIAELKKLTIPSLVIHGTRDPLVLLEHGLKCTTTIPNCKMLALDGMGHHLPEVFNEEMTKGIIELVHSSTKQTV